MSDVPMLEQWMRDTEGENLEFKSARNNFHFDELTQYRQSPRNRRVAEIFALCGLVERAGQGVDLMYCDAIRQSKLRPDFTRSDQYTVSVLLAGRIRNTAFIRFLKQFESDDLEQLGTDQWLVVDSLSREEPIPVDLLPCTNHLIELGMVVRTGPGRLILSEAYYRFQGREETYNRLREKEIRKEVLVGAAPHPACL